MVFKKENINFFLPQLIFFFVTSIIAVKNDFEKANQLYAQEQFEKALVRYKNVLHKGSSVYQNMGNCCFYLNNFPKALAYWKKAGRGASYKKRKKLYMLQQKIPGQIDTRSWYMVLCNEITFLLSSISLFFLQLLFLFSWSFSFVLLYYCVRKRYCFVGFFISTILMLFLWIKWNDELPIGVVLSEAALFSGPSKTYQVIAKVTPLESVVITKKIENWYKIKIKDSKGWIFFDHIKVV